jgi:hypothetical protein
MCNVLKMCVCAYVCVHMSSLMVHCFILCVIKIIQPLCPEKQRKQEETFQHKDGMNMSVSRVFIANSNRMRVGVERS